MPVHRELRIVNEARSLSLVRRILSDFLALSPFPESARNRIILAVDEAIANVVEHAYGAERGIVQITLDIDDRRLEVRVCDHGIAFKPREVKDPDIHEHIKLGLKGGLGMFLMRRVMDEVHYSSTREFVNQLAMVKFVPADEISAKTPTQT
jgi:serine/threonine-protein kinase RsbW